MGPGREGSPLPAILSEIIGSLGRDRQRFPPGPGNYGSSSHIFFPWGLGSITSYAQLSPRPGRLGFGEILGLYNEYRTLPWRFCPIFCIRGVDKGFFLPAFFQLSIVCLRGSNLELALNETFADSHIWFGDYWSRFSPDSRKIFRYDIALDTSGFRNPGLLCSQLLVLLGLYGNPVVI